MLPGYENSLIKRKTQQGCVDDRAGELFLPPRNSPVNAQLLRKGSSEDGAPSQDAQNCEAHNLQIASADGVVFSDSAAEYKGLNCKTIAVGPRATVKGRPHATTSAPVLKKSFSTSTLKVMALSGTERAEHGDAKDSLYKNMKAEASSSPA